MNILDIILLCLFIPGIIRGLSKGFLEQAIGLAGILVSVYFASQAYAYVSHHLQRVFAFSEVALNIIAFVLVLIVALFVVICIGKLVTNVVEMASLGWLNRTLGLIFAIALTAVVLGLLFILFDTINLKFELVDNSVLENSRLYGPLRDLGNTVFPYLKELLGKITTTAAASVSA